LPTSGCRRIDAVVEKIDAAPGSISCDARRNASRSTRRRGRQRRASASGHSPSRRRTGPRRWSWSSWEDLPRPVRPWSNGSRRYRPSRGTCAECAGAFLVAARPLAQGLRRFGVLGRIWGDLGPVWRRVASALGRQRYAPRK
jgi:hypothetical protein